MNGEKKEEMIGRKKKRKNIITSEIFTMNRTILILFKKKYNIVTNQYDNMLQTV